MGNSDEPIVVGVDTQTLIWALDAIESDEPDKEVRALWLMEYLTLIKAQVVLSTIVIGELLTEIDPDRHSDFLARLQERFSIVPFDVKAAKMAAAQYRANLDLKPDGEPNGRKTFKADLMIVAQAWASGATTFFTDDARCRKMANRLGMRGLPLPEHPPTSGKQPELPWKSR